MICFNNNQCWWDPLFAKFAVNLYEQRQAIQEGNVNQQPRFTKTGKTNRKSKLTYSTPKKPAPIHTIHVNHLSSLFSDSEYCSTSLEFSEYLLDQNIGWTREQKKIKAMLNKTKHQIEFALNNSIHSSILRIRLVDICLVYI